MARSAARCSDFRALSKAMTVGDNPLRKEGIGKLDGTAQYVDDIVLDGMLFGRTVRSTIAHGVIRSITFDPSFDFSQIVVADYRDIPGPNCVPLIERDQPLLAERTINHFDEPILLLAAKSKDILEAARRAIKIDYEELPPVFEMERSDQIFKEYVITRGDVEDAFERASHIITGEYRVPHQEQLYIEPQGMLAIPAPDGSLRIFGSLQCPHYVHRAIKEIFELTDDKVAVIQTTTGGGFGGKEEYPSMIAAHAALLARKSGRPVKLVYDRAEDIAATTKRHPGTIRHRTGVDDEGRIVSSEIEILLDGGAYVTLTPVVLSRAAIHASGPYLCPNIRITSRAVMTNTPPNGAFRGFGAPQVTFAYEMQIEKIAATLGIDPVTIRKRNMLHEGDITATGQVLKWSVGSEAVLDAVLERSDYENRRRELEKQSKDAVKRRGIGLSFFFHGAGFTGSGEEKMKAKAGIELTDDGGVKILAGAAEIGQGARTTLCQIVADELGVDFDKVEIIDPDTSLVPDSGPTVASRTCMVVGRVLQMAARELKEKGLSRAFYSYSSPPGIEWDDDTYTGDAYPAYSWGAEVAEVEVDMDTCETRVVKITTAQDMGRAIHPLIVEGQIEGGTLQAVGYGLFEEVVMHEGRVVNNRMTNYIIPTSLDAPDIETILVEKEYPYGPFGAKGIGELPMDGAAPAIAAAVFNATGAFVGQIPITPERLMEEVSREDARTPTN